MSLLFAALLSAAVTGAASLYLGFEVVREDVELALQQSADQLKRVAERFEQTAELRRWQELDEDLVPYHVGEVLRVMDTRGRVIFVSSRSVKLKRLIDKFNQAPLEKLQFEDLGQFEYVHWSTKYISSAGEERILQLALPMPKVSFLVPKALRLFIPSFFIVALFVAILAWALSQRILRPVGAVADHLKTLKSERVQEWSLLPSRTHPEFFGEVVEAVNGLINQIQESAIFRENWARSIAHEIRTPLMLIVGELETFDFEKASREEFRDLTSQIKKDVLGIESIIKTILEIGKRKTSLDLPDHVPIRQLVEAFARDFSKYMGVSITFESEVPDNRESRLEWPLLRILIDNLLRNSIKHAGKDRPVMSMKLDESVGYFFLNILDQGPGMPEDLLQALKQWKHWESRLGVGLNLCKQIERLTGWYLSFENATVDERVSGLKVGLQIPIVR